MKKEIIKKALMDKFDSIYVDIVGHDSDGFEFDVRCYGVDDALYWRVTDAICDIEDEQFPSNEISLSLIVFSDEETDVYYPEMALCLKDVRGRIGAAIDSTSQQPLGDFLRRFVVARKRCDYYPPKKVGYFSRVSAASTEEMCAPSAGAHAADESYALAA